MILSVAGSSPVVHPIFPSSQMTTYKNIITFIETDRLRLRQWIDDDRALFAELNADPQNMEFFPSPILRSDSDIFIDKMIALIEENGWGLFSVEINETNEFIGFIGLAVPSYKTHFTPCTEIGWRLHKKYWGNGYATEGAKAVLNFAFNTLHKEEIVSFTSNLNIPSISVMKRIGMTRDIQGDFEHPNVKDGHKLRHHVLYRINASEFKNQEI